MMQRIAQMLSLDGKERQDRQSFPWMELMVVVACIGILATIAISKFLAH